MKKIKIKVIVLLEIEFFIYSLASLFSKCAAENNGNLIRLLLFYGLNLMMLGIYSILWQQVLKKMPLSIAFSNKGIVVIWGMIWGYIFFKETITIGMIIGTAIIIAGIVFMMQGEEKNG